MKRAHRKIVSEPASITQDWNFVFFHIDWAALKRINTAIFNVTKNEPRSAESL